MQVLFMILLLLVSLFLILLILIQRGRGGGLAGAFGGMGGQSAFGTKAGDVFTRATIVTATVWILLCVLAIAMLSRQEDRFDRGLGAGAKPAAEGRQFVEQPPEGGATGQPAAAAGSAAESPAAGGGAAAEGASSSQGEGEGE